MLTDTIRARMVAAMKAKDKETKELYSYLLDQIQKEQKSRVCAENPNPVLTEADEIAVIARVVKQIQAGITNTIKAAEKEGVDISNLHDFIADSEKKINIYSEFLPKMMDESEINALIQEVINSMTGLINKGLVMKNLMPKVKGKADGRLVNVLVEKAIAIKNASEG